ncbi:succinate dehydrogenase, cytochrome b556 subunit [Aliidiomarina shirensis]|uniref:Succinate dehydrogenase cytochrome b556 subunit n=1 Tax=Aliidiomarina shirensis TaxID=1048642 RepID=A0A432WXP8_9GAMM|nr:succinate dehydrogenase, cytochrome b556 subunit [Aliidiomarina shirensis]RUO38558.1 succinate dehydrogenase, cytochrome b556 subunit [Aliidiomarina shirensis]
MKKQRPVNLELTTISFPPAAISSILHRVSGVIMLVLVGLLVWLLAKSLTSPEGFAEAQAIFAHPFVRFLVWGFLAALGYHVLAGIRHIFMDLGFGEEKESGKITAVLAIAGGVVLAILAGVWLW